ncbi:MAG TPA: hypothetical protein VL200_12365 [Lacunisphaera sp.]|jgi:hypothetical protein|nr:hypothetical protein [Lacunisphaera sp.]
MTARILVTLRVDHRMARAVGLALCLVAAGALRADDSLRTIFTPDEYRQAGLEKLSAAERTALLRALHERGLGNTEASGPAASASDPAHPAAAATTVPAGTPVEKKSLWVRIKDFGAEQLPAKGSKDEGEVTELDAQMTEPFRGLSGHTLFHLDNGQVWEQRVRDTYYQGTPIPNPKVTIIRTRFGYRIRIPSVGKNFDVAVKRIQ